jgi:hypothetical protein
MNFPSDWTILLARPIELKCGLVLRRLDDCVEYIANQSISVRSEREWMRVAHLLQNAATSRRTREVSELIECVLWHRQKRVTAS